MRFSRFIRTMLKWLLITATATFPAGAAIAEKALRVAIPNAESSFDPAFAFDDLSSMIIDSVMESMLDYDYLARPVKLVPRTLEAMPVVEDGGTTVTMKIKKGIFFAPDAAFKGKQRELTADDYAYALKRILDPAVKSPWLWLFEGKIAGADEARANAVRTGKFDYDAPIEGLEAVDRYKLKIRLRAPDLRFLYVLATPSTAAVAREVVEAYGNDIGAHPVGTGPYMLGEYRRSAHIELLKNPKFREMTYSPAGPVPATSRPIVAALKGKRLPLISRIEIAVIEEGQTRWLGFLNSQADVLFSLPEQFVDEAIVAGTLTAHLAARGIVHQAFILPSVRLARFDMENPVVGGYSPEKIALRRAISMAYNVGEAIRVLFHGRALPANGPIPPDVVGYDPKLRTNAQVYDPAAARRLLEKFGYTDRNGDGFRETPDGKPLVLEYFSSPTSAAREGDVLWKKSMDAIGLRMVIKKAPRPEITKMSRQGQIQMTDGAWIADYPDAESFMQLLYGPNAGQANTSRFNLPEFNNLFEQARSLPDSVERTLLFNRMTELVVAYAPWRIIANRMTDTLAHRWVRSYVPHPMRFPGVLWYIDIDDSLRPSAK